MRFHVLTLFPEMVENGLNASILGRAMENNLIEIHAVNIRDFTRDRHGKVDDYTYGGGAGMLMQAQPVYDAWKSVAEPKAGESGEASPRRKPPRTVYVTPQGVPFTQSHAMDLAAERELIFLCGHYEGIDARVLDEVVTDYVSIGDYVLTGGELPAMVMIDAIARLVPGVLHNEESAETESFHGDLLEYPQFSRPETWHDKRVPEVLLSGDHGKISAWRLEQSKRLTRERRPDLYEKYLERENLIQTLSANKRHNIHMMESLSGGRGEILVHDGDNVLLYDRTCRLCMLSASCEAGARRLMDAVPKETKAALTSRRFLNGMLWDEMNLRVVEECRQACYTQRNPLPVRHGDIRALTRENLPYLVERCASESEEYLAGRIDAKAIYGAFVEERLVGFAGGRAEGGLGLLYVEETCRGRGLGMALESFWINRQLQMGRVPYGRIPVEDEAVLKMQERLGLYLSKESVWRLERE